MVQSISFSTACESLVDLTAPGVNIISTLPVGQGGLAIVAVGGKTLVGGMMKYSVNLPSRGIEGRLAFCEKFGKKKCESSSGKICLIKRYALTLA